MEVLIKILVGFLFIFTPFSFAATEPWAFTVLQGVLVVSWGLLLYSRPFLYRTALLKPIIYTMCILIVFSLIQLVFAQTILNPIPVWHPITMMPLYTWEHLSLFITYLGVTVLVVQVYPSQTEIKHLLEWMVVCALLVALCSVSLPKGEYIYQLTGVRGGIGPFLNRNHAGMYFALNTLIALGIALTKGLEFSRRMLSSKQRQSLLLQQISLAMIVIALGVATVMTRSRGGMLSLFAGIFSFAILASFAMAHRLRKKLKSFFIVLVALLLSVGWITSHTQSINAFAQRATNTSEQTRLMLYRSASSVLKKYPVWGVGIGAMPVVITSYTEWDVGSYIERLHNDWLEIVLGVGCVGAGFILFGLIWFIWKSLYLLKRLAIEKKFLFIALISSLITMGIGSCVDFHFFIPANALLFFTLLGLMATLSYANGYIHRISVGPVHKLVILLVLGGAMFVPLQKTIAWRLALFGKGLKSQAKIEAYQSALSHYPSPRYALKLGAAYYNASFYADNLQEKELFLTYAQNISLQYLKKYPFDKELSRLYVKAHVSMGK